jgi:hypothetical protein
LEDAVAVSKGRGQWCVVLSPVAPNEEDGIRSASPMPSASRVCESCEGVTGDLER